jgi:hypothetical protein
MGIRFDCPNGHELHVKSFLAGKTGRCPECSVKVVIPSESATRAKSVQNHVAAREPKPASMGAEADGQTAAISEFAQWYVRLENGEQYGPATPELFEEWRLSGRVPDTALVWREGWERWKPAATLPSTQAAVGSLQMPPPVDQMAQARHSSVSPQPSGGLDRLTLEPAPTAHNDIRIEVDRPSTPPRPKGRQSAALVMGLAVICLLTFGVLVWVLRNPP